MEDTYTRSSPTFTDNELQFLYELESRHGSNGSRYQTRNYYPSNHRASANSTRQREDRRHHGGRQNQHYTRHHRQHDNYDRHPTRNSNSSLRNFSERRHRDERTEYRNQRRRHNDRISAFTRNSDSSQHTYSERRHRDESTEYRNQRRRRNYCYSAYSRNSEHCLPGWNRQRQAEMSPISSRGTEPYSNFPGEEIISDFGASQNTQETRDSLIHTVIGDRPSNGMEHLDRSDSYNDESRFHQLLSSDWTMPHFLSSDWTVPRTEEMHSATSTTSVNHTDLNSHPHRDNDGSPDLATGESVSPSPSFNLSLHLETIYRFNTTDCPEFSNALSNQTVTLDFSGFPSHGPIDEFSDVLSNQTVTLDFSGFHSHDPIDELSDVLSNQTVTLGFSGFPRRDPIDELDFLLNQTVTLDFSGFLSHDLTYEENLALAEQMGVVERGLPEETITDHLKTRKWTSAKHKNPAQETEICVVCQDEYEDQEIIGMLNCGHEYHANCIRTWLLTKNECPVCKQEALKIY